MKWQEVSITVDRAGTEAVANILHELGAGGVVFEDPQLKMHYIEGDLWDYYDLPKESVEEGKVLVKAYLHEGESLNQRFEELKHALHTLKTLYLPSLYVDLQSAQVSDEEWATSWKNYYKPEKIGQRVVIKPSWEQYEPQDQEVIVELDPGMAFGTGNHPTTSLCIKALEDYLGIGDKVYDVGTGSGVLAITAAKLGAGKVAAIDLDEVAVKIAKENVDLNQVQHRIEVLEGNLLDLVQEPADLVVANIIADIIIILAPDVLKVLKPGGIFIASGIIDNREKDVLTAIEISGLKIKEVRHDKGWVGVIATKEG